VDKALYEAKRRGRDRACRVSQVTIGDMLDQTIVDDHPGIAQAELPIQFVEVVAAA
jgi:hypothetical protein